jgi:hypothetical protein
MDLKIRAYFSPLADTDGNDTRDLAHALTALSYYMPDPQTGIVPFDPDRKFFDAIRQFQTDHGLFPGASLYPGDETERAINAALERLRTDGRFYLWRTVRDDKVRGAHALRNDSLFRWSEDLPGGHPGEDYNCRCWAEPYMRAYAPPTPARKPEIPRDYRILHELNRDGINPAYPIETLLGLGVSKRIISASRTAYQLGKIAKFSHDRKIKFTNQQLQSKFKHAKDFEITGNANKKTLAQFKKAIENHVKSEDTRIIRGAYQGKKVIHFYNEETGINVITDKKGNYVSGWKLSDKQIMYLLKNGKLGGGK